MAARPDELESEQIQQQIARTREQMSGTIDEIQERLAPSRILHDATASIRVAGADSVRRVVSHAGRTAGRTAGHVQAASSAAASYAKSHPLPTALLLSGVALVLARAFTSRREAPLTRWIAENPLAVGAAVAAAGTVAGLSRAARQIPVQGNGSVRR